MFPAGRQLPNLQLLHIEGVKELSGGPATAPEGSSLVSCCPGLQSLQMGSLLCSAELLAPLQGLSELQVLHCNWGAVATEVVQAVCQLTGLRELVAQGSACMTDEGLLRHLTQLKQLTRLQYESYDLSSRLRASVTFLLVCHVWVLHPTIAGVL
jgi:hypothetical protein